MEYRRSRLDRLLREDRPGLDPVRVHLGLLGPGSVLHTPQQVQGRAVGRAERGQAVCDQRPCDLDNHRSCHILVLQVRGQSECAQCRCLHTFS